MFSNSIIGGSTLIQVENLRVYDFIDNKITNESETSLYNLKQASDILGTKSYFESGKFLWLAVVTSVSCVNYY